jgi:lambda family phage portal protein
MTWFERYVVAPVAPRAALARMRAMRGVKAFYEAAEPNRYRKTRNDRRSANAQNERGVIPIRNAARHLDENFDIASGILDVLIANTVGTGIQPEPQVMLKDGSPADEVNRALLKLFDDWRFRPEVTWQHDYYALQRLVGRSWFRDGEVFGQHLTGTIASLDHGTIVPYSIEALEADFVPFDMTDRARGIVQGVELSAWGRPRGYWVYKTHPGDALGTATDTKRVPAERMMHLALRKRLHQVRGMSVFATVMNRLDDIKEIDECERIAAKVAAAMAGFIKKGQPDMYEAPTSVDTEGNPAPREMTFDAGIIFDDLQPGEEIGTIDTKRPNNALIPFRDSQLRSAAGGVGASFSSISKNYNGTYSAQRQELVEHYMLYQMLAGPIVYSFCQPVWDGFVAAAVLAGALEIASNVDQTTLYDATHTGPAMPWVDPEKELNAQILAYKWAFKSRSKIIRERGDNPDQVNREILRDQEELERLGIEMMGDAPAPAAEPAEPAPQRSARIRAV